MISPSHRKPLGFQKLLREHFKRFLKSSWVKQIMSDVKCNTTLSIQKFVLVQINAKRSWWVHFNFCVSIYLMSVYIGLVIWLNFLLFNHYFIIMIIIIIVKCKKQQQCDISILYLPLTWALSCWILACRLRTSFWPWLKAA